MKNRATSVTTGPKHFCRSSAPAARRGPASRSSSPPGPGSLGSGGEQAAPGRDLPAGGSVLFEGVQEDQAGAPGRSGGVAGFVRPVPRPTPAPLQAKAEGFRPRSPTSISRLGPFRRRPADRESNPAARRKHSTNEGGISEKKIIFSSQLSPSALPGGVCGGQSSSRGRPHHSPRWTYTSPPGATCEFGNGPRAPGRKGIHP